MNSKWNLHPDEWHAPLVLLVGLGSNRGDLGGRALNFVERAQALAGGRRLLELFPEHDGEKIALQTPLDESLARLDRVSRDRRTVVLASGDPFFFGIGRRLVKLLGKERLLTLPNITSVQSLFARLGQPWEDVRVLSLHGRGDAGGEHSWLQELRYHARVALLTDPQHTPAWIARRLMETGIEDRFLVVAEDLGFATEAIQPLTLEQAAGMHFSPLNLVAILPREDVWEPEGKLACPVLGLPDDAFQHQAGLITKREVRAVVLAQLQLAPELILWDLGAGSGSVSIEAARMTRLRQVIAVEKDARRYEDLQHNVRHFHCAEIRTIHGRVLDVLDQLPDPDRVFIGGSGGDLERILERVAQRLTPGGHLVQTAVTWDSLETARTFWRDRPFQMNVVQLQVNRSVPVGNSLRFEALNPVFILTLQRMN